MVFLVWCLHICLFCSLSFSGIVMTITFIFWQLSFWTISYVKSWPNYYCYPHSQFTEHLLLSYFALSLCLILSLKKNVYILFKFLFPSLKSSLTWYRKHQKILLKWNKLHCHYFLSFDIEYIKFQISVLRKISNKVPLCWAWDLKLIFKWLLS